MKKFFTLLFVVAAFSMNAQVYYSQDFEDGIPADWTQTTDATDGGFLSGTEATLGSGYAPLTGNATTFVATNDDGCNCDKSNELLSTGEIDLTDAAGGTVFLKFDAWFLGATYQGDTEVATVRVSTDGGASYTDVAEIAGNGTGWAERVINLSDYAGMTINLGFHYNDGGGWLYALAIDNISIEVPEDYEVSMETINMRTAGFTGTIVEVGGVFANNGAETITSIDVTWTDGVDTYTDNLTGLSIAPLETMDFTHSDMHEIIEGFTPISVMVANPNGQVDSDASNNEASTQTRGVTPMEGRKVVIEEGTGTWCTWCPRGDVFISVMTDRYPDHFIPIAVHNGDPMTVAEYDTDLGISAFPNMSNERTENFGFGVIADIEDRFFDRVIMDPHAALESAADYDPATGDLTVVSKATFSTAVGADHRLAVVLVEDGVTGTGSGYDQINAYAGGGNGPMGGYENLPSPVPAAQMVYDHVGRVLVGGFGGDAASLPEGADVDDIETHIFETINLPSEYEFDNIHVVTLLLNGSGHIINGTSQTLQEVVDNEIVGTNEVFNHDLAKVFPNPFSDVVNIRLNLETASDVNVRVMNSMGQLVAENNYDSMVGDMIIPFQAENLANGMYTIHLTIGDTLVTKKVMLQK